MASAPIPVRLSEDLKARVDAWATDHGLSRSAAIVALLERGLGEGGADAPADPNPSPSFSHGRGKAVVAAPKRERVEAPARDVLRQAEANAAHLGVGAAAMEAAGVPFGNTRGAYQKGAKR